MWDASLIAKGNSECTPLETAVIKDDLKQVEYLLKNGVSYVNEPDSNGWTVLHLSCSWLHNIPRLAVTKFLLHFPETDCFAKNDLGNIPFHYYVTMNLSSNDTYLELLKFQIEQEPKIIYSQNHEVCKILFYKKKKALTFYILG